MSSIFFCPIKTHLFTSYLHQSYFTLKNRPRLFCQKWSNAESTFFKIRKIFYIYLLFDNKYFGFKNFLIIIDLEFRWLLKIFLKSDFPPCVTFEGNQKYWTRATMRKENSIPGQLRKIYIYWIIFATLIRYFWFKN